MSKYHPLKEFDVYEESRFLPAPRNLSTRIVNSERIVNTENCGNGASSGVRCTCSHHAQKEPYASSYHQEQQFRAPVNNQVYSSNQNIRSSSLRREPVYNNNTGFNQTRRVESHVQNAPQYHSNNHVQSRFEQTNFNQPNNFGHQEHFVSNDYYEGTTLGSSPQEIMISKLKRDNQRYEKEIHELKKRDASSIFGKTNNKEFTDLKRQNQELISQINSLQTNINILKTTNIVNLESEINNYKQKIADLENMNIRLESANSRLENDHQQILVRTERKVNQSAELSSDIEMLKTHLKNEVDNSDALNVNLVRMKGEYSKLKDQYDDLKANSISRNEHINILNQQISIAKSLENENINLQRQLDLHKNEKLNLRREVEVHSDNYRRVGDEFNEKSSDLQNRLNIEIENRQEMFNDLEKLKRKYEILYQENEENKRQRVCKYHNVDGTPTSDNKIIAHWKDKLEEKNREVDASNQQIQSLKNELQSLRLKLSETMGNYDSSISSNGQRDREQINLLRLNNEEVNLKNIALSKEIERLREQINSSHSVHKVEVHNAPVTSETTYVSSYVPSRVVHAEPVQIRRSSYEVKPDVTTTYVKSYNEPVVYREYHPAPQTTTTYYQSPSSVVYKQEPVSTSYVPQTTTTYTSYPTTVHQSEPVYVGTYTSNAMIPERASIYNNRTIRTETAEVKNDGRVENRQSIPHY